ncbi:PQQ-binding-like beta-propeller repeat protein [Tuwongella immobilis]|uniref:Pyrrolo-quinoline quinone repeat domain-containing protein n=1 Tax=Tuwongella immobilis TaxID=692036 RepID=A0A6C2YIH7_9BACT|nr:PQQ-binding-like beta-propeller repeat protein [Tuwongella immobilis]VIP01216.1 Uncharacterized protein OS=Planctomyces limnophilus (strain ATCC 43296 / DSM 3776 / IFAM 1008 / 290) GN=Plim_2733 PE=4 SV=1: PQQ_2 [Tuwongella immobilis]VTR97858.1 Uncharacterized protein OS=Planctomyces limnophilus (strain ATCC 43296 / DSM 3776 / IFAM 1008 / 290) GN=Plim_2733 PE=4 SV=1: PQQ_2 [Tuwongella immobilis]
MGEPTSEPTSPSLARRIFRVGVPQLTIVITLLLVVGLQTWPHGHLEEMYRHMGTFMSVMFGTAILSAWFLFATKFRWVTRILPVALWWGGIIAGFQTQVLYFDGDSQIHVRNPFAPSVTAQLSAFEATTASAGQSRPVALTPEKPTDATNYRGRDRSGIITGMELPESVTSAAPKQLWKRPIGGGYAGIVTANDYLVTIEQRDSQEATVCYDAESGKEVWAYTNPAQFQEVLGGPGPRATPTIDRGDVYTLGATGHLARLDGSTGQAKWTAEILANNENLMWGMCGSPLIVDNLVIVNPGAQSAGQPSLRAYDRDTGKVVWESGKARAGYSSPMLATLAGIRQVLLFDGEGIAGYDPTTGKEFWRVLWTTNQGINVAQPIVVDDKTVFVASGYGVGGGWVEVTPADGDAASKSPLKAKLLNRTKSTVMRCKFTSPVLHQGHIYGLNDGKLECIDARTGEVKWKDDRRPREGQAYGHGQLLLVGKWLVMQTEFNEVVLIEATPDELREGWRIQPLEGTKSWNTPTIADGRLYVRSDRDMAAFDLRK